MFERILVPLDGSAAAEMVLPYVTEVAASFNSEIFISRVCESREQSVLDDYHRYLENAANKIKLHLGSYETGQATKVQLQILTGHPASEILNYAGKIDCGLIALASRGESSQTTWPLGNIASKILRASQFPVLLIKNRANSSMLVQKKLFRRVLLPLDGSKLSESAIPLVVPFVHATGASLVLLRVAEPVAFMLSSMMEITTEVEQKILSTSAEYLNRIKESLQSEVPNISIARVTATGFPADKIIDYSEINNIDLIAMSTHGRSGIGRWVFGSVTEKVIEAGDKPVLVLRPKQGQN